MEQRFLLGKTLYLKNTKRLTLKMEGLTILEMLAKRPMVESGITIQVLLNMTSLQLLELQIEDNPKLITTIDKYLTDLSNLADHINSSQLTLEVLYIKGKLELTTRNIETAEFYYNQAIEIASLDENIQFIHKINQEYSKIKEIQIHQNNGQIETDIKDEIIDRQNEIINYLHMLSNDVNLKEYFQ